MLWSLLAVPATVATAHFSVFSLLGALPPRPVDGPAPTLPPLMVVIPAWREGPVLLDNVAALRAQRWDGLFGVTVVADQCDPALVAALRDAGAIVHDVAFPVSTKTHAIRHALTHLPDIVGAVVILDADNVADPGLLAALARHWRGEGTAVQGRRLEKNRTSSWALLEAWMERVNHVVYRAGRARVGLSAALVGSAMLFDRHTLTSALADVDSVGGFDKGLEIALLCRGVRIGWAPDAVAFDEKVDDGPAFVSQKRRWVSAQWAHLRRWTGRGLTAAWRHRSLDPLDKLLQWSVPPRSLLLAGLPLLALAAAAVGSPWAAVFGLDWLLLLLATAIATAGARTPAELLAALPRAGLVPAAMLLASARSRGADRTFIHTAHARRADPSVLAARLRAEEG